MKGEMTIKEFSALGVKARMEKTTPEQRKEIATKGGQATKAKYGIEHYQELNRKSLAVKKAKKQTNLTT